MTSIVERVLPGASVLATSDANGGRGVFSSVVRVTYRTDAEPSSPASVVVKLPLPGANGDAARRSGAYDRESLAYRRLLPLLPVARPRCHGVVDLENGPAFVLEDLGRHRFVDQLDGLGIDDAIAVAVALASLHRTEVPLIGSDTVRSHTASALDPGVCRRGLDAIAGRWADAVPRPAYRAFEALLDRRTDLVARLANTGPLVLCHGDPRADNVAFAAAEPGDRPVAVLFDWQQIARQPGVTDLAWLIATSVEPAVRASAMDAIIDAYSAALGHAVDNESLALGFVLPGLAVLLLAQREVDSDRTGRLIATSLRRIGRALVDLEIPER